MVMDAFKNELYQDEHFWMVVFGLFFGLMFLFRDPLLAAILPALVAASPAVLTQLRRVNLPSVSKQEDIGEGILLGIAEDGRHIRLPLESLNHMFIIGMTRYGKTRLVYSLITEFIQNYRPDEIKLAFSDAKAVSFNVFARSQHLFAPLATSEESTQQLIALILEEMNTRKALFQEYHEKICTNVDEYYELTGERLPRIIVIFDEVADSVEMNSKAEKDLTTLAKMGLAYGIHLVLITQRPTKEGITHEVTSQCQTILSTYMKNQTEYGSVAKIPKDVYSQMQPVRGKFMIFSPDLAPIFSENNGWGFLMSNYMDNKAVQAVAKEDSTQNLDLPSLEMSIPSWGGSADDKLNAIWQLEQKLGSVTREDMKKYFGIDGRTAKTWLEKYAMGND